VVEGAYFASHLTKAKADGRIGRVAADPLLTLRALVDIGGTGAKADNFVICIDQVVGREIRVLDHYEAQGQPIEAHLIWLRSGLRAGQGDDLAAPRRGHAGQGT
jgi:phage terminase large subunit